VEIAMVRVSADERRQQLIDAAFRVMARDGVTAASVRAIAAEAGAPLASFHYCYRSKEELLRELTPPLVEKMLAAAVVEIRPGTDLNTMLRDSLRGVWAVTEKTAAEQHVLYELTHYSLRNAALEDLANWQYERTYASVTEFLDAISGACAIDWTPPLPVLSRMVAAFLDGLMLGWLVDRDSKRATAALELFAEQLAGLAGPRR
jgi:AcrR family transcriptional regulator